MDYETFSVYGFRLEYPANWKVEIKQKSERKRGDVNFYSPTNEKTSISWDVLQLIRKRYSSLTEHVEELQKRIKKSYSGASVEVAEQKELEVNGHDGIFMHLKIALTQSFFFKRRLILQDVLSLHTYCDQSERYFVLYGSSSSDKLRAESKDIFYHMRESFKCHLEEVFFK